VLKAITLYGVGPYHDPYRLDIKPLTILCGANGTGKSTWIEMIRRLRNSLDVGYFPFSLSDADSLPFVFDPAGEGRRNATFRNALVTSDEEHEQYYGGPHCSAYTPNPEPGVDPWGTPRTLKRDPDFGWFGSVGFEIQALTDFDITASPSISHALPPSSHKSGYAYDCILDGVVKKGMLFTLRFCLSREVDFGGTNDEIQAVEFSMDRTHSLFLEMDDYFDARCRCYLTPGLVSDRVEPHGRYWVGVLTDFHKENGSFVCHPSHVAEEETAKLLIKQGIARFGAIFREATDAFFYLGPIRENVNREKAPNAKRARYVGAQGQHTLACYDAYARNEMQIIHSGKSVPFSPQFDHSQIRPEKCLADLNGSGLLPKTHPLRRIVTKLKPSRVKELIKAWGVHSESESEVKSGLVEKVGVPIVATSREEVDRLLDVIQSAAARSKQLAFDRAQGITILHHGYDALAREVAEEFNKLLSKRDLYAPGIWNDEIRAARRRHLEAFYADAMDAVDKALGNNEHGWAEKTNDSLQTMRRLSEPGNCYEGLQKRARRLIEKGVDQLDEAELQLLNRMLIEMAFTGMDRVWHHPGFVVETYFGAWLNRLLGVAPFPYNGDSHGDRATPLASDWGDAERPPAGVIIDTRPDSEACGYDFQSSNAWETRHPNELSFTSADFSTLQNCQATVHHLSTGFHQLAPIILQGGLALPGEIVAVQNPEAHLHPELQIGIAEYFVNEAKTGKIFVIETHSDLIIRRALRAILQEEISQNHVGIYFTEKNKVAANATSSSLKPITVDAMGRISNWPKGFMDADIKESRRMMDAMYGALEEALKDDDSVDGGAEDEQ
jgi:ABC-type lipoprotein export system ATPase subunit